MSFRALALLATFATLANLASTYALAQTPGRTCNQLRVDDFGEGWDVLNLRETPNGRILGQVPIGEIVNFLRDDRNGWFFVSTSEGYTGYMFANNLVSIPCGPVQLPPAPPQPADWFSVARCYDAGGSFGGRTVFELNALKESWQPTADALEGRGSDGSFLTASISNVRTQSGAYRNLEIAADTILTQADGRQARFSNVRLEAAAAGRPRDEGRIVLGSGGFEKTYSRCEVGNQSTLFSRAGDYLVARCRGTLGETLADIVLRLDAEGRADRLVTGSFEAPINSISRRGTFGRRTSYVVNTQQLGAGLLAPQTIEITPGIGRSAARVDFRYEGSAESFTSCEMSNEFLLSDAF